MIKIIHCLQLPKIVEGHGGMLRRRMNTPL